MQQRYDLLIFVGCIISRRQGATSVASTGASLRTVHYLDVCCLSETSFSVTYSSIREASLLVP